MVSMVGTMMSENLASGAISNLCMPCIQFNHCTWNTGRWGECVDGNVKDVCCYHTIGVVTLYINQQISILQDSLFFAYMYNFLVFCLHWPMIIY